MRLRLVRYCYGDEATEGRLLLGKDHVLRTIERPWIPGPAPGGTLHLSCVPDGLYELRPHVRPNGDRVLALRNPDLGVYHSTASVPPEGGRTLILIHPANWVHELEGCIAPGMSRMIDAQRLPKVNDSRQAMALLMAYVEGKTQLSLSIERTLGAFDN